MAVFESRRTGKIVRKRFEPSDRPVQHRIVVVSIDHCFAELVMRLSDTATAFACSSVCFSALGSPRVSSCPKSQASFKFRVRDVRFSAALI